MESSDALTALRAVYASQFPLKRARKLPCSSPAYEQETSDDNFWVKPSAREIGLGAFLLDEVLYRAEDGMLVRKPTVKASRGRDIYGHHKTSTRALQAKKIKVRIAKEKRSRLDRHIKLKERRVVLKNEDEEMVGSSPKRLVTLELPVIPPRRTSGGGLPQTPPSTMSTPGLTDCSDSESEVSKCETPSRSMPELPFAIKGTEYDMDSSMSGLVSTSLYEGEEFGLPQAGSCGRCVLDDMFELYIDSAVLS